MKIVCEACQAKYSIADDKLQGKVFKIRCKKCSHVIIVRGTAAAAAAPEPAAVTPPSDAVWHVVIDQEQVGPLTAADVEQRFAAGDITADTYTWREGLADWQPFAQVDTFAALVTPAPTVRTYAAPAVAVAADVQAVESHRLRAERNESSVLFSLSNLSQIAAEPRRTSSPAHEAAGGEGSGLLDIRSMASAYSGHAGAGAVARPASSIGSIDDLPVFGGATFAEPAVMVPTTAASTTNARLLYAMIGGMVLLTIAAIVMLVMLLRDDKPAQRAAVVTPKPAPTVVEPPAPPPPAPPAVQAEPPPVAQAALPAKQPAKQQSPAKQPAKKIATPKQLQPAKQPATEGSCEEVSCVVNGYSDPCCAKYRTAKQAPPKSDLPAALDKPMISAGMASAKSRVAACSGGNGTVMVKVYVAPSGSVSKVNVESTPSQSLSACVVAAVQKASFAATQKGGSFRIPFTF